MKIVYFTSAGRDDATRASIPIHLAVNGSAEVGHDTQVVIGGDATDILLGDAVETMEGVGVPPMRELVAKLKEHAIPVYV